MLKVHIYSLQVRWTVWKVHWFFRLLFNFPRLREYLYSSIINLKDLERKFNRLFNAKAVLKIIWFENKAYLRGKTFRIIQ